MELKQRLVRKIIYHLPIGIVSILISKAYKRSRYPVVLMFHHVLPESELQPYAQKYHSDSPTYSAEPYSITPQKLEELLMVLKQYGFEFVFEDDYRKSFGKKVILSFDDGYSDNYVYAYPILLKYQVKASINLIANNINNSEDNEFLSVSRILEMKNSGLLQFQAHTLSHPMLTNCSVEECTNEIVECKQVICEKTGIDTSVFVYPCGQVNDEIFRIVKQHFQMAYGGEGDGIDYMFKIPRIEVDMSFKKKKLLRKMLYIIKDND